MAFYASWWLSSLPHCAWRVPHVQEVGPVVRDGRRGELVPHPGIRVDLERAGIVRPAWGARREVEGRTGVIPRRHVRGASERWPEQPPGDLPAGVHMQARPGVELAEDDV